MNKTRWNTCGLALVALVLCCALSDVAAACNVPVFRYALERWRADPYRVIVLHRGLGENERELIRHLEKQSDEAAANLVLEEVDVSKLQEADANDLLAALGKPELPRLIVRYPEKFAVELPLWSAPFSRETVDRLTDSPVRKELVRRLADGQTAVWLIVESGDEEKDKSAAALVDEELKKLEKELKLPELTDDPKDVITLAAPLEIAFSVLRVPRGATEEPLVEMLVRSESDLAARKDPLVFPVFGRGRALLPLVGAGITPLNIQQAAAFLVGACSCEVKEQNPGFDLLLAANWDDLLTLSGVPEPLVTNVPGSKPSAEPELVPIPHGSYDPPEPTTAASPLVTVFGSGATSLRLILFAGGVILLVAIACLVGWATVRSGSRT